MGREFGSFQAEVLRFPELSSGAYSVYVCSGASEIYISIHFAQMLFFRTLVAGTLCRKFIAPVEDGRPRARQWNTVSQV